MRPKCGGEGGCRVSANENSCAHHVTWSPNKLWRSTSIFNLWLIVSSKCRGAENWPPDGATHWNIVDKRGGVLGGVQEPISTRGPHLEKMVQSVREREPVSSVVKYNGSENWPLNLSFLYWYCDKIQHNTTFMSIYVTSPNVIFSKRKSFKI